MLLQAQRGPGSDGNEGVLHIPQSSSITRTSASDRFVSYPGHSLGEVGLPLRKGAVRVSYNQLGNTQFNVKTVLFEIIQFNISMQFRCQNSSILNNSI